MEILVNGQGTFAREVFDLDPAFHGFVIFFHWPSVMVETGKEMMGYCSISVNEVMSTSASPDSSSTRTRRTCIGRVSKP